MRVTARGEKGLLGDHDVTADVDPVLVVEPDALTDPGAVADAQLPGELDPRARAEDDLASDLRTERSQSGDPQLRADLPRTRDDEQLHNRPEQNHRERPVPRGALSRGVREIDHRDRSRLFRIHCFAVFSVAVCAVRRYITGTT